MKNVNQEIDQFEHILIQTKDILECRIENVLTAMSVTSLCDAPTEPCTIDEFVKITEETLQKAVQSLSKYIALSESAANEILDTLRKSLKENDKNVLKVTETEYYESTCFNFLTQYTQRNNEALVQCTRFTLDTIKKRLQQTNKYIGGQVFREKVKNPLFKADIILSIPNISIRPTLDDMQSQLNKAIQAILKMSQDLPEWKHALKLKELQIKEIEKQAIEEGEDPKAAVAAKMPKPLHKVIAEHKDVNKVVISLSTCMSSFKEEVVDIMKNFTGFSELWEKEPEPTVKEFMATKPLIVDIEAKFRHYKVVFC